MFRIGIFFLLFAASLRVGAQVLPKEGSLLNYRLVGFSFPMPEDGMYKIEFAPGNYDNVDSFRKKIQWSVNSKRNKIVAEVPSFGASYTWRVVNDGKAGGMKNTPLYHFATGTTSRVDSTVRRLNVSLPASAAYKDYFAAVDAGAVIYDMKGRPVWYLPEGKEVGGYIQDLKITPQSTLSFMYSLPIETNLNGDVLWKAPLYNIEGHDSSFIRYHHEFTRLSNGHYMALGMQIMTCKQMKSGDSSWIVFSKDRKPHDGYEIARFGTVIEYDEQGNVVWKWMSSGYLIGSDFGYFHPADATARFDPHDNSFFFDEKNKVVYVSFRNLNRIVKIEYPSGKLLEVYGENFKPGAPARGTGLFCNPHSLKVSREGYLYFFNNNSCQLTDSLPTIVFLKEPASPTDVMKKIWEYTCPVPDGYSKKFGHGGSVKELEDGSVFVCMGSDYSKLFIVNKEKQVEWSALPEIYRAGESRWALQTQDRANLFSRREMEDLVWNAENAK